MPRKLEEITATYTHERFRFGNGSGDVVIGEVVDDEGGRFACKFNEEDESEPTKHLTYHWYGGWSNYTNKRSGKSERQFHAKTFVRCQPHGRAGVIAYLAKAPNIGRVLAGRLWAKFGSDAVKILRTQPDVAAAGIPRLSADGASEAAGWLDDQKTLEGCMISLVDLLDGRGFPKTIAKHATKEWGNQAAAIIKQNPYRLMNFNGVGFKRADALYLDLGHNPAALKRQALCAWHAIAQRSSGDTWHYIDVVRKGLDGAIGGTAVKSDKAIRLAVRGKILSLTYTDGLNGSPSWDGSHVWAADARHAGNENRLAGYIREANDELFQWPAIDELSALVSDHQRAQLDLSLMGPIAILGGSPGTGKTYTAAKLIGMLCREIGPEQIGVAAPTGKAAVRLTEALSDYGIPLAAKTWHSLLGVESADGGWSFKHHGCNPLPFKVLIGDESSMLDTSLAASIFAARALGTLVLLIGDVNQLPPVGHGAPLRDMIASGLPYGELREIRRNSGAIVEACAAMRDGKQFECGDNLVVREGDHVANMLAVLAEARDAQLDPVWDCQVLCAVNKKSPLSRHELNKVLQAHLNTSEPVKDSPFRLADKVVNTKNGWFPPVEEPASEATTNDEGKVYVANGELGRVVKVEPKYMHVTLSSPKRVIVVPRGASDENDGEESTGTGCNWDLGYALSTHRAQGSEWPIVLVMVDESPGAARVCSREHLYTSISRAKKTCYLIGKESVAQSFAMRTVIDKRKTFLRELLTEGV